MIRSVSILSLLVILLAPAVQGQAQGLKVYISADMEGVAGAVTGEQLGPSGFEYGRFREFVTEEVNAAIRAARAAGATEFVVSDSHGNGQNLLLERLPQDITVVRSWPRPLMMMEGVDESFDAALFIGYHASTTNPRGVRAHTLSSATLAAVRLNGREMSEAGISAAIAGHFGVPVVMISGDDAAVDEARAMIGDGLVGAVVKWNLGFHSARTLLPEAARDIIAEAARRGVETRSDVEPFRLDPPLVLDLTFKSYMPAQVLAYLPNVERVDAHTVRFVGRDMPEVSAFLEFAMTYSPSLTP
ncbi:MAG: M55 family metallopeptidase [Gemmatimonadetes bacterium]|nr:M55 family metallopeptidase [Gemmatimonadota bacterium]